MQDRFVVGVDVGGDRKGFHAVLLRDGQILGTKGDRDPAAIVAWCLKNEADVVAVDAPCRWSQSRASRSAERELGRQRISCFSTPVRENALNRSFYRWVFNGERLYRALEKGYPQFNGQWGEGHMCIETFPHAIVCALEGRVVPAHPKNATRRFVLRDKGLDVSKLSNIDFVDAALCAIAAEAFCQGRFKSFGDDLEGYIIVPVISGSLEHRVMEGV